MHTVSHCVCNVNNVRSIISQNIQNSVFHVEIFIPSMSKISFANSPKFVHSLFSISQIWNFHHVPAHCICTLFACLILEFHFLCQPYNSNTLLSNVAFVSQFEMLVYFFLIFLHLLEFIVIPTLLLLSVMQLCLHCHIQFTCYSCKLMVNARHVHSSEFFILISIS